MRRIVLSFLACIFIIEVASAQQFIATHSMAWSTLPLGSGGLSSGNSISNDGKTWLVRTDTYGAYICDSIISSVCKHWTQLVSVASLPASVAFVDNSQGVYEIVAAPNDDARAYMMFRGNVYVSTNVNSANPGWNTTACPTFSDASPNDGNRQMGRKFAVDPQNSNVAYFGTPTEGLYVTFDGGATCNVVASVTASAAQGIIIAFDQTSGTSACPSGGGTCTNTIYASSYGNGVYASTNAGTSFSITTNTPTTHRKLIVAADGIPYLLDNGSAPSLLWKYTAGAWANVSPGGTNTWGTVVNDPFTPGRLVLISSNNLSSTLNRGTSWVFVPSSFYSPTCTNGVLASQFRSATDVPWLGPSGTKECGFTIGNAFMDPVLANRIHLSEGIGDWYMDFGTATTQPNTTQTWNSETAGIEQLVANWVLSSTCGSPITFSWDRAIFKPNGISYPTVQTYDITHAIVPGWHGDYATTDPSFIVAIVNTAGVQMSGSSSDCGVSWTTFASFPASAVAGKNAGSIAAYDHNLMVWCPNDNGNPAYSINGAAAWTNLDFSAYSVPTTGETGWGFSSLSTNRHICTVDRVTPRTFYLYNYGPTGHSTVAGVYRVVFDISGNPTVTKALNGAFGSNNPSTGFNAEMRAVPGGAGELFYTSGQISGSTSGSFYRLVDSGAAGDNTMTATAVSTVLEVYAFGFGATLAGNNHPSIFMYGAINSAFGYWRSDASSAQWAGNTAAWVSLGTAPLNSFDSPKAVEGDATVWGKAYIGYLGSGFAQGTWNWLLHRDLDPASNDNSPAWLDKAA